MKSLLSKSTVRRDGPAGARGFSVLEALIVVSMIAVVASFALLRFAEAQRMVQLDSEVRRFKAYVEKARVDSIRRHAQTDAQMAKVSITSATSYTVEIDADGDGLLDAPIPVQLPPQYGMTFTATPPIVIRFNWRGRTADSAGTAVTIAPFKLKDSYSAGLDINLSSSGMALGNNVNMSPVTSTFVPTNANIQTQANMP